MLDVIQSLEERLARLIGEVEQRRIQVRQLETEVDGLRITAADRDRLEADLRQARAALAGRENDLVMVTRERDALLPEKEKVLLLETEVGVLKLQAEDVAAAHHQALEVSRSESEVLRSELAEVRAELQKLADELATSRRQAEAGAEASVSARAQALELEAKLAAAARVFEERDRLASERIEMVQAIHGLRSRLAEYDGAFARIRTERDELAASRDSGTRAADALRARVAELEAANEAFRTEAAARAAALEEELAAARTAPKAELDTLRSENEELKLRVNEFVARDQKSRDRLTSLINTIERAETLLEQAEQVTHVNT